MNVNDDSTLLRQFATRRDELAFTELVGRHLGMVYHAALRQTNGDTLLAEDAAQATFTLLADKAATLCAHPELAGWLYSTACLKARELRRGDARCRQREQTASTMSELHVESANDEAWNRVRPLIDDALLELPAEDRAAVLLRHFEGRPFSEIGAALRLGENAARMRVDRALDRLQGALAKRGITSTTAALASVLAVPAALAIPAGLASKITGVALAGAVAAGTSVTVFSILQLMISSKSVVVASGIAAAAALGTAVYFHGELKNARAEASALHDRQQGLQDKVLDLESRLAAESERAAQMERRERTIAAAVATKASAAAPAAEPPLTPDVVQSRFKKAQDLARNGQPAEALREFLWCYDTGMRQFPSLVGVRSSYLLGELTALGKTFPPALAALRERRDAVETRLLTSATDSDAALDYGPLNHALGEDDKTLVVFDSLPANDRRREPLRYNVADQLLEARRYAELVQAMPYQRMKGNFERTTEFSDRAGGRGDQITIVRRHASESAAKNIEALAGAGDLDHAREFLGKVVAFDNTPETRALLAKHLERAGHPELLSP
jgi:RNA polymerase sigma factor (sigma-70 family)